MGLGVSIGLVFQKQQVTQNLTAVGYEKITDELFPKIDWAYWQSVNEDVVGWITVPGTNIDYPLVQARTSDPHYYLSHDVHGNWNYYGCPYIASGCESGLESKNVIIYGHNVGYGDTLMFASLANMSGIDFANDHQTVLIQTPTKSHRLEIKCTEVSAGWEQNRAFVFESENAYALWLKERKQASKSIVNEFQLDQNVFSLVTCSYNYWNSERTISYAQEAPAT